MSTKTWLAQYLPGECVNERDAPAHVRLKWEGLTAENLARHGMKLVSDDFLMWITDGSSNVSIDSTTCAYCHYYDDHDDPEANNCLRCPIVIHTGKTCYADPVNHWDKFTSGGDVHPMLELVRNIELLEQAARANLRTASSAKN